MAEITGKLSTALADRYRIERHLGDGGMATVFLAHDLKHDRPVALKVLRPELAAVIGGERFLNEIKVTANLQHPHILPLHDSGDANGFLYYVMPFIEGQTLRDKLSRERQLSIEEAIEITRSIASALDYAHRHGVIHRDIKPENILLHEGQALVADFGIALAVSQASGQRLTETGLSIGTPHYMSPEQAMGDRELDARSDVYSLGAMLYEMLAGDPPYQGSTAQAIVAKVITEKAPPVTVARDTVPAHVAAAVAKALAKMPADRFSSAAAFADALVNPGFGLAQAAPYSTTMPAVEVPSRVRTLGVLAATCVLAILAAWGWMRPQPDSAAPVIRYEVQVPQLESGLATDFGSNIALSPDGRRLAYTGADDRGVQLWIRERNQLEAQAIAGAEGAHQPFFSPDGNSVAFITGSRALRIASLTGEPIVTLADSGIVRGGGTWGSDGYVYVVAGSVITQAAISGISRLPSTGGPFEQVTALDTAAGEAAHTFPDALPNGRGLVFTVQKQLYDAATSQIAVVDIKTRTHRVLTPGIYARWSPTGHLVVVRADGSLVAAPFDPHKLELTGSVMPLLEGVGVEGLSSVDLTVSATGTLMYQPGAGVTTPEQMMWTSRTGAASPVDTAWAGNFGPGSLSPDSRRYALEVVESGTHVWIKQLDAGTITKMTFEGAINARPTWTPDSRSVLFISSRGENADVYIRRADGSTDAELLLNHRRPITSAAYSKDGRWLVFGVSTGPTGPDVYARRTGDTIDVPIVAGAFAEGGAALSPDGRWLAYVSNESGPNEVYVRPFPSEQARWQISSGGGTEPRWSPTGRELFYVGQNGLMKVDVQTAGTFAAGRQTRLFSLAGYAREFDYHEYDVAPSGNRFIMNRLLTTAGDTRLIVVDNWFAELRERTARR